MSAKIKRGMLIRNLRETDETDVVLDANGASKKDDEIIVATKNHPDGLIQRTTSVAEIRWPWETETAWRRVIG